MKTKEARLVELNSLELLTVEESIEYLMLTEDISAEEAELLMEQFMDEYPPVTFQ